MGRLVLCSVIFCLSILGYDCFAQTTSSTELITWAKHYDGTSVKFEGEIIGDIMVRGPYAWINIYDGINAIGVWVERSLLDNRLITGGYKSKGSWVEVRGIFSRTCLEHGGDLDIHAREITIKQDGYPIQEKVDLQKSGVALASLFLGGAVWLLAFLRKPRKTKRDKTGQREWI